MSCLYAILYALLGRTVEYNDLGDKRSKGTLINVVQVQELIYITILENPVMESRIGMSERDIRITITNNDIQITA